MTRMHKLTHETLTHVLDFDPATGIFVWKVARSNRVKPGSRAGVVHQPSGGRYIAIDGEKFMAHRLAWFYVNRNWPKHDVRPVDGNYDNCAIENLRDIPRIHGAHERAKTSANTSGYLGVSPSTPGKWQAAITWNYKQISLGANFDTTEKASAEYNLAAEAFKMTKSDADVAAVLARFNLRRRQRAAWDNLVTQGIAIGWASFDDFAVDVTDVPKARYAIAPIDATKQIGPENYKWATGHGVATSDRVAYNRATREANRDHYRGKDFQKNYGIDFAEYQRMLVAQKGVCAICDQPETKVEKGSIRLLSVDHDHKTGAVRGLLCANCNLAIGYACDDPTILQKAIGYLRKHDPDNVVKFEPSIVGGVLGSGA